MKTRLMTLWLGVVIGTLGTMMLWEPSEYTDRHGTRRQVGTNQIVSMPFHKLPGRMKPHCEPPKNE